MFVMVSAWSRHQYAEIVCDQKMETWLSGKKQTVFDAHAVGGRTYPGK